MGLPNPNETSPPPSGYIAKALLALSKSSPLMLKDISRTTRAVGDNCHLSSLKACAASKRGGMKARGKALSPDTKNKTNLNRRQDSIQSLISSWDDTEDKMTSHKRKHDAMMNLAGRASHGERKRPVVAAGTKGSKHRREKTEERQSNQCSRERRLPLAPLTAESLNPASLMKQGKNATSHSQKSSSDTILVHIPS